MWGEYWPGSSLFEVCMTIRQQTAIPIVGWTEVLADWFVTSENFSGSKHGILLVWLSKPANLLDLNDVRRFTS